MKNPQALCYNKFRLRTGDFLCAKVRNMCWKTGGSYMEKKKKSMKLRTRVIISFFIIILVPIVMCALTFYFFVGYKAKIIGEKYGLANATYRTISNNTLLLNAMTSEEYDEVEDTAKSDTAKLEETNYLSVLNARLQKKQSFIAVREDGVIIYNGSEELSSEELENELPKYGDPGANLKGGVYFRNEKQWMVKQVDYENSDGKECSAFIVTKPDQIAPQITGMVKELGIVIVLILVLTSLGLSFWIYRGVIGPLEQLKKATQNIKDGNLDFTVEPCGVAEINDLCEDFEEMRIRLKETAEEKVEFDKENKELISNISHDLKTPITAVKGYVEGIMDGVANTPEKMDRYIRTIYNKANEMDRLINELTFYSKIDTNRIPYTFNKINVRENFDDCVEEVGLDLESKNIELSYFNSVENDVLVIADAEQLKRVINNIVGNSIKYMDKPKGYISIRVKDVGDFIQVEIEDNGRGISTEVVERSIGEKVYDSRVIGMKNAEDPEELKENKGSGFGLMNCKGIIEKYKKTNDLFRVCAFNVESELGMGRRFYFRLPLGIRKIVGVLLCLLHPVGLVSCVNDSISHMLQEGDSIVVVTDSVYEDLLDAASDYANAAYFANVEDEYELALQYIVSAMMLLNEHYEKYARAEHPQRYMKVVGEGIPAEISWWNELFDSDYHVILDIRNEAAVAFLALKQLDA